MAGHPADAAGADDAEAVAMIDLEGDVDAADGEEVEGERWEPGPNNK